LFAVRKLRSSFSQTKKCGEAKVYKGALAPTGLLRSPSRPQGGEALAVCYVAFLQQPTNHNTCKKLLMRIINYF